LKEHKANRKETQDAMAKAKALRGKEAADFAKESMDLQTNIAALGKAIPAIQNGIAGAFLQTNEASIVRTYAMERADLSDASREELVAFLSGTQEQGYAPQSGEILGILKQLHDEMTKSLEVAESDEKSAIQDYEALMAAKLKENSILTKQIEQELARIGAFGIKLATAEHDIEDTTQSLADDQKFLAQLGEGCKTKTDEWEVIKKTRAAETLALAETIQVLNDDDALELFKKTLPSSAASFMQVQVTSSEVRGRARAAVNTALAAHRRSRSGRGGLPAQPELQFIALALSGKKQGFAKVIKMVDDMVALLGSEQKDDDAKKDYCEKEFDSSDDKKKGLENSIADSNAAIADMGGSIESLTDEISELTAGIKALDKSVAEATALRKQEHSDHTELMAADSTAKEVLQWAKNRLNKFYNKKLYKQAPEAQLIEEGTGIGASFVQMFARSRGEVAPAPPPETFGKYEKKSQETNGVIAMIDLLVADLSKEMAESDVMEKDAQKEYEATMAEAATKRAENAKSITDKASSKAVEEESLQAEEREKKGSSKELKAALEYIHTLHGDCDWLVKYYDTRKAARAQEVDSLGRAKAALSGADYSLVQTGSTRHRRFRVQRK